MKPRISADRWLAVFFLALALVLVVVWVPLDTGTGLVERVRRKYVIGDALGPTIAGAVILIGAALVWLRPSDGTALTRQTLVWLGSLLALFVVSLAVMRYAGPLAAAWTESGYRPLRATPPWSYIGFVLGGTVMIGGLTGLAQRRFALRDFAIGFAAALVIALVYDLPFDDLLLPPNGDL
jgi:cell division protein FtsX